MFILTQFIGLYVVNHYSPVRIVDGVQQNVTSPNELPYGMQTPEIQNESDYSYLFVSLVVAFIIAILLLFGLMHFNFEKILKVWFFLVVTLALGLSIYAIFTSKIPYEKIVYEIPLIATLIALPLAAIKLYGRNFIVHNFTELFIYPGIAAVFVPILNLWTMIALLILISIYDMWAVWHSGIMQKMAKYQMNKLKIFSGFFIPHMSKAVKMKIQKMKKSDLKKKSFKVNVAILGGGDVVFPIITAGVMLKTFGLLSAILVIAGATLGLAYLFMISEKKKFYPAMPFITAGIFIGMILSYLIL